MVDLEKVHHVHVVVQITLMSFLVFLRISSQRRCGGTHLYSQHFERLRHEDCEFKVRLGSTARTCLKKILPS
jgi:hypothetical protein